MTGVQTCALPISLIPEHKIYVEPFCGGASLFFAKDRPIVTNNDHYREVLNDTNKDLINLYYIAQSKPREFIEYLNRFPYSEYWHNYFKQNIHPENDLEKAVGFYIRIMMSFSKKLDSGFSFDKLTKNKTKGYFNHLERLPQIIDRLKGIYIFCRNALDIIKIFD